MNINLFSNRCGSGCIIDVNRTFFYCFKDTNMSPKVTSLKSLSLPTQVNIKSAPSAAFAGVSAFEPLYSVTHLSAFALCTIINSYIMWPAFDIYPAIG